MIEFIVHLFILSLASWRLSLLFAVDDGPFGVFLRLRLALGLRYDEKSEPYVPEWGEVVRRTQLPMGNPLKTLQGTQLYMARELLRGLTCLGCSSVWFGLLLAAAYFSAPFLTVALCVPLALSALSIGWEKILR